jgi:hypothetical protein
MQELISLVVTEPPNDGEETNRFKYSNIACELLTSNVACINDTLASNESLLNQLYSFLETDKQLNPLLASFFSKIMSLLLSKISEKLIEFLKTKEQFVPCLIKHFHISAIMDFTLKLVVSIENTELRHSVFTVSHSCLLSANYT